MCDDPGHFLSCPLLRPLARVRHDRLVRHLATLIQRAGGAAYVEPRYLEDKRPDIHAFFPDDRVILRRLVLVLRLVRHFVIARMVRFLPMSLLLRKLAAVLCLLLLSHSVP